MIPYKFYWLSKHFINVEHSWDWGLFLLKFIILLKLVGDGQSTKKVTLTDPVIFRRQQPENEQNIIFQRTNLPFTSVRFHLKLKFLLRDWIMGKWPHSKLLCVFLPLKCLVPWLAFHHPLRWCRETILDSMAIIMGSLSTKSPLSCLYCLLSFSVI